MGRQTPHLILSGNQLLLHPSLLTIAIKRAPTKEQLGNVDYGTSICVSPRTTATHDSLAFSGNFLSFFSSHSLLSG